MACCWVLTRVEMRKAEAQGVEQVEQGHEDEEQERAAEGHPEEEGA